MLFHVTFPDAVSLSNLNFVHTVAESALGGAGNWQFLLSSFRHGEMLVYVSAKCMA
jgi:hypothetical protein